MTHAYDPVVMTELGDLATLPTDAVLTLAGVAGPNFTIGGKAVIFADGTASDGSGQVVIVEGNQSNVLGYEHIQLVESDQWFISHSKNSKRIHITIWDEFDEMVYSDSTNIIDVNNVLVTFNTPIKGRAILMIF